ncbi:MAG: Zn-dependent hydrolase [Candidatus Marinimicrobia bacterium]|nr:Zn-dependent hydrolase [Candidatus Neomarinimicrobiota bacterium]
MLKRPTIFLCLLMATAACGPQGGSIQARLDKYALVELKVNLSGLTGNERAMLPLLIEAAQAMDPIYWDQAYGDPEPLLRAAEDDKMRQLIAINYGPWDRLAGDEPFLPGAGAKPAGANFYPADMTSEEFEAAVAQPLGRGAALKSLYTLVRSTPEGALITVPYSKAYAAGSQRAAGKLREAARFADDDGLRRYLNLRADALLTDDYLASDVAWMEMKNNRIDIVIGPIETYEDGLFGYKAAHEAYVLIKDLSWSERLSRYGALLPALQRGLPVPEAYKREIPGGGSDLNAYDVIYYAGQSNTGPKTIAINLPNDERVQLRQGTRRLQLKNVMRAKFDKILTPIGAELIAPEQREHITFDAFFSNTMFHEVAHGLGIKNTVNGKGTVRLALKEQAGMLEEGKADVLGLYLLAALMAQGELDAGAGMDHQVTFLASIFRSIRFGASSAHGVANVIRFNYFKEQGAFERDGQSGHYAVVRGKMEQAIEALAREILMLQGNGDYEGVLAFRRKYGAVGRQLQTDLDRLESAGIPVDITFRQGLEVLGLAD